MSWALRLEAATSGDDVMRGAEEYVAGNPEMSGEARGQVWAAADAAKRIIDGSSVGQGAQWLVQLGGHANPGHKPAPGWANDSVSVNVWQAAAVPSP